MIAALSAYTGVQPQYNDAEVDALVEDVLIEVMAEMDGPPAIAEERLVTVE